MEKQEIALLETVERAVAEARSLSKQPRFTDDKQESVFEAIVTWIKRAEDEISAPDYKPDSRKRDQWLREFWRWEPHWAGIINQSILIDSGRAWTMTGGRNQVRRFTAMMHDADGGRGWRHFCRRASLSYRVTDMGHLCELGREGEGGPLRAIYHLDSARCYHTGKPGQPLAYQPARGKRQYWKAGDYFNVTSLPNDDERFRGLGWCATSRAFELVKILYGVFKHDQEMIGAAMPRGLLLLQGISDVQWQQAMRSRQARQDALGRKYFGGVFVLATSGQMEMEAKMVGFSQLPANFDRQTFVDQVMYGYALVAGYDPREFWPVSSGALGTATETETQHRKAAGKGALEFPHAWQERFQRELPDALHFEFEQRDAEGELLDAEVAFAWAEVARTLYEAGGAQYGVALLPRERALSLLVDRGVIPHEWTEAIEEQAQATDVEQARLERMRKRALEYPQVRQAVEMFPREPILRSTWNGLQQVEHVLWPSGDEARRPAIWPAKMRQDDSDILYADPDDDLVITEADVDRAIADGRRRVGDEFAELLTAKAVE